MIIGHRSFNEFVFLQRPFPCFSYFKNELKWTLNTNISVHGLVCASISSVSVPRNTLEPSCILRHEEIKATEKFNHYPLQVNWYSRSCCSFRSFLLQSFTGMWHDHQKMSKNQRSKKTSTAQCNKPKSFDKMKKLIFSISLKAISNKSSRFWKSYFVML